MRKMQKKQAGFTILEIGIVMIILVSLVVTFSTTLWDKQRNAEFNVIKVWFAKDVPEAMVLCRSRYGRQLQNVTASNMAAALQECGLQTTTFYEATWTAGDVITNAAGIRTVAITYPLTGMTDEATEGPVLAQIIGTDSSDAIVSSTYSAAGLLVTVNLK